MEGAKDPNRSTTEPNHYKIHSRMWSSDHGRKTKDSVREDSTGLTIPGLSLTKSMAIEMPNIMYLRTHEVGVPRTRSKEKSKEDLPNQPYPTFDTKLALRHGALTRDESS